MTSADKIKQLLAAAHAEGKVSHAYMLEGSPEATQDIAQAFAKLLVGGDGGAHPDIRTVTNSLYAQKKETIALSINTIREMKNEVYVKPYAAKYKVYIIPNADTLTIQAQNSLLKILEEPPSYCVIILLANTSQVFLPTILSRVTLFHVQEAANSSLSSQADDMREMRLDIIKHLTNLSTLNTKKMYEFVYYLRGNKQNITVILEIMQSFFNDVLQLRLNPGNPQIANTDMQKEIADFSSIITEMAAAGSLEAIISSREMLRHNTHYNAVVQYLIITLSDNINGIE